MAWKKGQSGNPGGRRAAVPLTSKELDLMKLARANTRSAFATVLTIMRDRGNAAQVRLAAADIVLNRGHGKPTQYHANPDGSPLDFSKMSTEELRLGMKRLEAALGVPSKEETANLRH